MDKVFLSLGSNLNNKILNIKNALNYIKNSTGEIIKTSLYYETEPWGFNTDNWFVNIVIEIKTDFSANILLQKLQEIEKKLGRKQKSVNSNYTSRIIDIDILFYNNLIIQNDFLQIPHKHLQNRIFVLKPLNDIAANFTHPILKKTITQLLDECFDKTKIRLL